MEALIKEGSLGYILMKSHIISEDDIRSALEAQQASHCRFGEALVTLGVVTQEDIDWALANQLDIPYVRLKKDMIDAAAVALLPAQTARQYNLIPLIRAGDELNVAMADPLNRVAIEAVERSTGCQVIVSVALIREIREMQDQFYGAPTSPVSFGLTSSSFSPRVLEIINGDITGATFLDYLLAYFIQNRLTVLSLQPLGDMVSVTARRGGATREIGTLAITHYQEFMIHLRRSCKLEGVNETSTKSGLSFTLRGQRHNFQVLLLRGLGGDFVTFKQSHADAFPARLADLHLASATEEQLRKLPAGAGMVVVAHRESEDRCRLIDLLLSEADTAGKSVILLGEGLGQGTKRFPRVPAHGISPGETHSLISAVLEHDPDVLAIEDATESQSFIAAGKAAMRGKLVIVGVSLKEIGAAVRHLLYFWHKHYIIPTYIRGIVSCRRVSLLCPACRQPHHLSPDESAALGTALPSGSYFRASGCPECEQSGYRGSRFLLDVINFDSAVVEAFETASDSRDLLRFLTDRGYRGSAEEGDELLRSGEISPEEYVTSILL